jgi:hypothetical protein
MSIISSIVEKCWTEIRVPFITLRVDSNSLCCKTFQVQRKVVITEFIDIENLTIFVAIVGSSIN